MKVFGIIAVIAVLVSTACVNQPAMQQTSLQARKSIAHHTNYDASPVYSSGIGDLVLRKQVFDSELVITGEQRFAGSISSIRFRGKEYIDVADNGRQLQSAVSYDDLGECDNPTEAGTREDRGRKTSSVLKSGSVRGSTLTTVTQMAYWAPPNTRYSKPKATRTQGKDYCGARPDALYTRNKTVLSRELLTKQVTIGVAGMPNVIDYKVQFQVPEAHKSAAFEAFSAHLPREFSRVDLVDLTRGRLMPAVEGVPRDKPVIISTPNGQHALGVYSPMLPKPGYTYGWFLLPEVSKWNVTFRERDVRPGNYNYEAMVVIGTRDEVFDAIVALPGRLGR